LTLKDIEAHCEKHETRMDGAHAKMDKLSDGQSDGAPHFEADGGSSGKIVAVAITAVLCVAAVWYVYFRGETPEDQTTHLPVIDSHAFVNGTNGMRVWVNASDSGDRIVNVTLTFAQKTEAGNLFFWPTIMVKVYWVNHSSAEISDVILLVTLPAGEYRVSAFATDESGNNSTFVDYAYFRVM